VSYNSGCYPDRYLGADNSKVHQVCFLPPMPFVKPNTQKKPTPYLFLSNCGPRWGVTPDVVRELLHPFCSDPSQVVLEAPDSQSHYW
jgi:hypothetical protein